MLLHFGGVALDGGEPWEGGTFERVCVDEDTNDLARGEVREGHEM